MTTLFLNLMNLIRFAYIHFWLYICVVLPLQLYLNDKEFESEVDVYRDAFGSFSPLVRTYIVDAYDAAISIVLCQRIGETMLSAFQLTYVSPFTC